jgi:hypothetical protein
VVASSLSFNLSVSRVFFLLKPVAYHDAARKPIARAASLSTKSADESQTETREEEELMWKDAPHERQ